ncbi:MAG TPA: sugar phosphate isomerase/epimerase family protein [Planctomycetota bacterium]|nr:sugar phosphate isomerase/epimerase family protein [Planctomycetota bacterium]
MASRRSFLKTVAGAAGMGVCAPSLLAVEPFVRNGPPRLLLSLAAYSFRDFFIDARHKRAAPPDPAKAIDMFKFIDYCAEQGCAGELTSYFFPKDVSNEYLLNVRRHAFLRGVPVSGTAVGNNFALPQGAARDGEIASVKAWIDRAALLGAPHIRVFAGSAKDITDAEARKMCISALEECSDYAGTKGIFLGLENHGGIVAEPEGLLEIIKTVKSQWLGINLDSGNFHGADPYAQLEMCAPYAVNVQIKVELKRKDAKTHEASDLPRLAKMLKDVKYQGYVALEYEAKEDPWQAVPPALKKLREVLS